MVASVITALVLNVVWELDTTPWAVGLAVATALAAAVGVRRGHGRPVAWRPIPAIGAGRAARAARRRRAGLRGVRARRHAAARARRHRGHDGTVDLAARHGRRHDRGAQRRAGAAAPTRSTSASPASAPGASGRSSSTPASSAGSSCPRPRAWSGSRSSRRCCAASMRRAEDVRRVALRAGRRSLQPAAVKPRAVPAQPSACDRSAAATGVVLRGKRKLRFYTDGRRVAAP